MGHSSVAITIHIPKSVVAIDLGSNCVRFSRKIKNPATFKIVDIKNLASLFNIEFLKMIELIIHTINAKRNNGKYSLLLQNAGVVKK
jgi:hypothetical protein